MKIAKLIFLPMVLLIFACQKEQKETMESPKQTVQQRPNIILLLADDQRFNTIASINNAEVITPNLDKLASQGVYFANAYIMGGNSGAVCMPSRAMLNTGRNLFSIDNQGQRIPEDHQLLGEVLQSNGYNTFGTGKWHNGKEAYARSFNGGDEIFFGGMNDHWNVPVYDFDSTRKYKPTIPFIDDPWSSKEVSYLNADHINHGKHSSELFTDAVINYIENYQEEKPFFIYTSFMAPHDPRSMPEKYLELYDTANIELPPNFMAKHPFDNGELVIRDEKLASFPRQPKEVKVHIRDYFAMITHLDEQVGRILDVLRSTNQMENTIIVYTGDNGLAVGQHGLLGKQNVYEHSVKVPLLISGPSIPVDRRRNQLCYIFDLYPTLLELVDIETPNSSQGISLVPAFTDSLYIHREALLYAYRHYQRSVRQGNMKLIEYLVKGQRTSQLFNIDEDPYELSNLALDPEYQDDLQQMRNELIEMQQKLGDTVKIVI